MGRIRTELIAVIGLIFCVGTPLAHASGLEDGLIAWWRMELKVGSTIPDASGNCHDLTVNGSPTFEDNIVIFNDDGTLETPDSDALDLMGDWSTSFWAREDSNDHSPNTNGTNGWMSKVRAYHDSEGGWFLNSSYSSAVRASIYGSPNCNHDTPDRLTLGAWYRITTTFDSATSMLRIYLNQNLEYEADIGCIVLGNDYPVLLGGNIEENMTRRPYCKGAMSDIRIYDRTLSDSEVAELFAMGSPECAVRHEILLRSGLCPTCQETDPNVLVSSASAPDPQPALIWGGNIAPECDCGTVGKDPDLVAVTTHSTSDTWGNFTTTFELPEGVSEPVMSLKVRADDGAEIYLNETLVQTIDLTPVQGEPAVTHEIVISNAELFGAGVNTLEFYVVNTQNGHFGSPTSRGGPGDCMYVQFEARVVYGDGSVTDCNENGVDDECDQGICTCLTLGDVDRDGSTCKDAGDLHAMADLLESGVLEPEDYCTADLDGDGQITFDDLHMLIDPFECPADLDCNGEVRVPDLIELLADWGQCTEL